MTNADKLKVAQARRRATKAAELVPMISVQVYEGARLAEDAALNPDTLKTWVIQQVSRFDGRITGMTIYATPEQVDDLGQMKGDR